MRHPATASVRPVYIHGGAVAGCAAAIAARQAGAHTIVYEKSLFPRHKVCGEFLSAGVETLFAELGLWESFVRLAPARMTKLALHFPCKSFHFDLPRSCWGVSRFTLDVWLKDCALGAGAEWRQELAPAEQAPTVLAHGRKHQAPRGHRLFGFKAHHTGPPTETIELHFFDGCYVGVNPVEDGIVNVCGLGPEEMFRDYHFRYDEVCSRSETLRRRRSELKRSMDWLSAGPLLYRSSFSRGEQPGVYPAGDALGFVDPFTGTGMFNALLSGSLAGKAAANGEPVEHYLDDCRRLLHRPFWVSSLFRRALASGIAERAVGWMPGSLLFHLTRAQLG